MHLAVLLFGQESKVRVPDGGTSSALNHALKDFPACLWLVGGISALGKEHWLLITEGKKRKTVSKCYITYERLFGKRILELLCSGSGMGCLKPQDSGSALGDAASWNQLPILCAYVSASHTERNYCP